MHKCLAGLCSRFFQTKLRNKSGLLQQNINLITFCWWRTHLWPEASCLVCYIIWLIDILMNDCNKWDWSGLMMLFMWLHVGFSTCDWFELVWISIEVSLYELYWFLCVSSFTVGLNVSSFRFWNRLNILSLTKAAVCNFYKTIYLI